MDIPGGQSSDVNPYFREKNKSINFISRPGRKGSEFIYLSDDAAWYLPIEAKAKSVWVSKEEAQRMCKETHPHLYDMMKRHECITGSQ